VISPFRLGAALALVLSTAARGAESIDDAMKRATLDYAQRLGAANDELTQARERIDQEKAPLLKAMRAAEVRITDAEVANTRLEAGQERSQENFRKLSMDLDALRRNEGYLDTVAHDSLSALNDGLLPGERQVLSGSILAVQEHFNDPGMRVGGRRSFEVASLLLSHVERSVGGYTAEGSSMVGEDNQMTRGTFAFVGPETFFRPAQGGTSGTVRAREGTGLPVTHLLPAWNPAGADEFFSGRMGTIYADATAGKALRLKETKGTVWQHVRKGGVVSYAILCIGALSLLMILQKVRDLSRMKVDNPEAVQQCLVAIAAGSRGDAERAVGSLRAGTRELFTVGLRNMGKPKELLEEHLDAVLLRGRLHYERWLPLLAVIATAAPLMGLLGTVTGMVRTFALITVFGTGNAGNLASGISEVLVATELGLMVAIPTLIAHGYLSNRIQKNLSLLERYSLEFVTAVQAVGSEERSREATSA
jgi:biopolymer transport protein ExbB